MLKERKTKMKIALLRKLFHAKTVEIQIVAFDR